MVDNYYRTGMYPFPSGLLGSEGAGVVVSAGSTDASKEWVGKRCAYVFDGALAEFTAVPVSYLVQVPSDISFEKALVLQMQGLTAHFLTHSVFALQKGQWALVHAAGSGVGNLAAQIACKVLGANVVGTCSTSKMQHASKTIGASAQIVDYSNVSEKDLTARLRELTGGVGFHVAYDSVGKTTYETTLDVLRPRGLAWCVVVIGLRAHSLGASPLGCSFFGNASGLVPPIDMLGLSSRGSLSVCWPNLRDFVAQPGEMQARSDALFGWVRSGLIELEVEDVQFPLERAGEAQQYVEKGKARGKVVVRIQGAAS
jgi:NADPH2:quinone reductase